jgi:hypothetical protein
MRTAWTRAIDALIWLKQSIFGLGLIAVFLFSTLAGLGFAQNKGGAHQYPFR